MKSRRGAALSFCALANADLWHLADIELLRSRICFRRHGWQGIRPEVALSRIRLRFDLVWPLFADTRKSPSDSLQLTRRFPVNSHEITQALQNFEPLLLCAGLRKCRTLSLCRIT
jgi:hypothetical protein